MYMQQQKKFYNIVIPKYINVYMSHDALFLNLKSTAKPATKAKKCNCDTLQLNKSKLK